MERTELQQLTKEELIDLVLRLQRLIKDSRTSSMPPSTDKKERRLNLKPGGAKPRHEPRIRQMAKNPDVFEDHTPVHCTHCGHAFANGTDIELIGEYDAIDLSEVKPDVVRHRRFACHCDHCGVTTRAAAPIIATSTQFGPRIHSLAIYPKTFRLCHTNGCQTCSTMSLGSMSAKVR